MDRNQDARASSAPAVKPQLVRLFEAVAAVMDLDEGQTRLELVFDGGHLRRWYSHSERHGADELARYDERASWLIVR